MQRAVRLTAENTDKVVQWMAHTQAALHAAALAGGSLVSYAIRPELASPEIVDTTA